MLEFKLKKWTKEEDDYIIEKYDLNSARVISEYLDDRSLTAVKSRITFLFEEGLLKPKRIKRLWSNDETNYLIDNFSKMTYQQIADNLERTLASVKQKVITIRNKNNT